MALFPASLSQLDVGRKSDIIRGHMNMDPRRSALCKFMGTSLLSAAVMFGLTRTAAQANEVVLHGFATLPNGAGPTTSVVLDSSGNLYGTTTNAGTSNAGVVYKVSAAGALTVLHTFTGGSDGGHPQAGVILDSAGNLYGTTSTGGASGQGIVFKLKPGGQETVLYNFTGGSDGGQPYSALLADSAGNLYGTAMVGGSAGQGVVFKVSATGQETVLHSFAGSPTDGAQPVAGVIRDSAGNLYGTTPSGGTGLGIVFKLSAAGQETVLYNFGSNGYYPLSGVVRDSAGNLYGTTYYGGTRSAGTVYKITAAGHESVLHNFTNGEDGGEPMAGVVLDSSGNLYGTTYGGGPDGPAGAGVVFELNPAGTETVLHGFTNGVYGAWLAAGVYRDSSGDLYGTTEFGGPAGLGVVYKLDSSGNETVLYGFAGGTDGSTPFAAPIRDSSGNLYGTTAAGGPADAGVIFRVDSAGSETVLYSFTGPDGQGPYAGLVRDSGGNLYGTTCYGGTANAGVVFELTASGQELVLYNFSGGSDGACPESSLVRDSTGNLYGTASSGGTNNYGLVFELNTAGQEKVLYDFTGGSDGCNPYAEVIRDSSGNLYGTTPYCGSSGYGVVYKLDAMGIQSVLHSFTAGVDGASPQAGVIMDPQGNLYGTTTGGGTSSQGTIFKIDASGQESVLYSFTGGPDSVLPLAGVVRDSSGNLYGTTYNGGAAGLGSVYQLNTEGTLTVLCSFNGTGGQQPMAGVILDSSGDLFGTTTGGSGTKYGGVVFEIIP
jgi:uncharacterized repeat protein (TIGR03803 family)